MNYLQIEFKTLNEENKEMLIALLTECGFESFEESDKSLKAFIKEQGFVEDSLKDILKIVPVNYAITVVAPQNWNARWESSFEPIIVKDLVAIRAAFHQPLKNVQHEIIITPKMSFGTGHHATTYMMIEQMATIDFRNKSVLDFGTGTAVLSILASKMGASSIDAIDNDGWSLENSIENKAVNDCVNICIKKADTIEKGKTYDIILANINLNVILENMQAIAAACNKSSLILLSGFLVQDEHVLIQALSDFKISYLKTLQKDGWICIYAEMN